MSNTFGVASKLSLLRNLLDYASGSNFNKELERSKTNVARAFSLRACAEASGILAVDSTVYCDDPNRNSIDVLSFHVNI